MKAQSKEIKQLSILLERQQTILEHVQEQQSSVLSNALCSANYMQAGGTAQGGIQYSPRHGECQMWYQHWTFIWFVTEYFSCRKGFLQR